MKGEMQKEIYWNTMNKGFVFFCNCHIYLHNFVTIIYQKLNNNIKQFCDYNLYNYSDIYFCKNFMYFIED